MKIFGIVNVTPDSFSDGGLHFFPEAAIKHGAKLAEEGADVLDIGGESTRPGAAPVSAAEEIERVVPVIEGLAKRVGARLSIDTMKPDVAKAAIAAGAEIWNDVSALRFDSESVEAARALGCHVVLMHMQGEPRTMQSSPTYDDVVEEVFSFLAERVQACAKAGIPRERIMADPGIGFGKTLEHNLALFGNLERFQDLGVPLMLGASRKRFIEALDRPGAASERLGGSLAAAVRGLSAGFQAVRVHDVAATRQALSVASAIGLAKR